MIRVQHSIKALLLASAVWACNSNTPAGTYAGEIETQRQQNNDLFKDPARSPLPAEEIKEFTGLNYFPVDEKYKVKAQFTRTANGQPFNMPHTNNKTYVYVKYGELSFELDGKKCVLATYQSPELTAQPGNEKYLFIPFTDLSSGKESYGGGRYLEFSIPDAAECELDFNRAYNPYCCYNSSYSCPIPPAENDLPVAILAGEKKYKEH